MQYLLEEDPDKRANYWIIDIETKGLGNPLLGIPPEAIHCICLLNLETQERIEFYDGNITNCHDWFSDHRIRNKVLIGHNILSFDLPCLNKFLSDISGTVGVSINWENCIDTMVLSQLYNPTMPDGHSLGAWGRRLKSPKQEHSDWETFSPDMLERCRSDCRLTRAVYLALSKRMRERGFSEKSCWIEHGVHVVIDKQMQTGVYFDRPKAGELLKCLRTEQERLQNQIRATFKPELRLVGTYKYRVRADGEPYASFLRHKALVDAGQLVLKWNETKTLYSLWIEEEFNIGSPSQRLNRLLSLGYTPQKQTKKGRPSVDEESLVEFAKTSGINEVQAIADWLVVCGRANAIENWISFCGPDNRIHGRVFSCGASNRRMIHVRPNGANIPKTKTKYGHESRALWRASPGKVLVGIDAKGLEMRVFGDYLGDMETARLYIEGDPHKRNEEILSANPWGYKALRDTGSKNGFYAFIYGAQDKKLGQTFDTSIVSPKKAAEYGAWGRKALLQNTPGLERLVALVQSEFENNDGFIKCIDGGYVRCTAKHAALNYKISSSGMILMKLVDIRMDEEVKRLGLNANKVLDIHDEDQWECDPECAETVGQLGCQMITQCGEELGFIVKMEGSYKVGNTWAETH